MNQKRFSIKIRSCDIVQNRQKIVLKLFFIKSKKTTDRTSEALQNNSEIELSSIDEI